MPMQPVDTPELLDAALAVSLQTRREKLVRAVRNQRILMRVAFGLSGCIAIFALAAYLIGDYAAARGCAKAACVTFALTYFAGMAARKKRKLSRTSKSGCTRPRISPILNPCMKVCVSRESVTSLATLAPIDPPDSRSIRATLDAFVLRNTLRLRRLLGGRE
jgi:hypothetical protein